QVGRRAVIDPCGAARIRAQPRTYVPRLSSVVAASAGRQPDASREACLLYQPAAREKAAGSGSLLRRLGLPQIYGGSLALITALQLEAHPLAFVQVADAGALDGRDVYEHIFCSILRLNEAVAFLGIEPLHGSDRHFHLPQNRGFAARKRTT